jgi:hypothetical protein
VEDAPGVRYLSTEHLLDFINKYAGPDREYYDIFHLDDIDVERLLYGKEVCVRTERSLHPDTERGYGGRFIVPDTFTGVDSGLLRLKMNPEISSLLNLSLPIRL